MVKEEVLVVKEEVLMVMEEIITKENAVKAVVKNSIMEEDIMKAAMDSIVAHPIAIGTTC